MKEEKLEGLPGTCEIDPVGSGRSVNMYEYCSDRKMCGWYEEKEIKEVSFCQSTAELNPLFDHRIQARCLLPFSKT